MRKQVFAATIAALVGLSLAACSTNEDAATSGSAATSGASTPAASTAPLTVEASFYPLKYLTEQIGGDRVSVDSLTPDGAEPHDLELSPQKVAELGQADAVVYLNEFQAAVDDAVATNAPKTVIDVASAVNLMPAQPGEEEGEDHDHEGESGEEAEHDHDHGMNDPHFWLDPARMKAAAETISAGLTQASPADADLFKANTEKLTGELDDLSTQLINATKTCQHHTFVTAHAAFGYLANVTGLTQMGISGLDPDSAPSPARLQEISTVVKDQGISTIFTEALIDPKVADTLADDLGITTAVLDPIESQVDPAKDYQAVMKDNIAALQKALDCQ